MQSCFGHTEGTAGMTGALLALSFLGKHAAAPVVNLRTLNPYVDSSLDAASFKRAAFVPRQCAPGQSVSPMAGTSSFGMSGVNAHAILTNGVQSGQIRTPLPLQKQKYWPLPTLHPFVKTVNAGSAAQIMEFSITVDGLAFLRDHAVFGSVLMPATGMFEIMRAAAAIGADTSSAGVVASTTIQAPLVLGSSGSGSTVCRGALDAGTISISNSNQDVTYVHGVYGGIETDSFENGEVVNKSVSPSLLLPLPSLNNLAGNNIASIAPCPGASPIMKFFAHPACMDASIHLAPVPRAGAMMGETKVPTAVGGLLTSSSSVVGSSPESSEWASARTISEKEGSSNITWLRGGARGGANTLVDLVARPMSVRRGPSSQKSVSVFDPSSWVYHAEWQSATVAEGSIVKAVCGTQISLVDDEAVLNLPPDMSAATAGATLLSIAQQVMIYDNNQNTFEMKSFFFIFLVGGACFHTHTHTRACCNINVVV